jgi:hypothetical protein
MKRPPTPFRMRQVATECLSCTVETRSRSKFWNYGKRQQSRPRDPKTGVPSFAWI